MTSVTFFRQEGRLVGFRASGHTGYAEAGEDIVCAAVSALCQTAVLGVQRVIGLPVVETEDESAPLLELLLEERFDQALERDADLLLRTLEEGVTDISKQHPAFVRVIHRERRQKP
jgi:hypothetical protein